MAAKLQIASGYLSAVERGAKPISEALLVRIEKVFVRSEREKEQLRQLAAISRMTRTIPPKVAMKAFFVIDELWLSISELEDEEWMAIHTVLDVMVSACKRRKEEA